LCTQAIGKLMRDKGYKGSIINISNTAGYGPSPTAPAYGAAKAAMGNLTQSCAVDLGPYGIWVNTVMYGLIVHDGNLSILGLDKPGVLENIKKNTPLGRAGSLNDVADPCIFLASEAAKYVSGTTIIVSGRRL
jgi:NAD(P)-dependent dehydrogenase (short-subunit alcohol dehydrogenase family)